MSAQMNDLLTIRNLSVSFNGLPAVDRIDLNVAPGEVVGVVGESGGGKSVTALSILRLIRPPGRIEKGSTIRFEGNDLLALGEAQMGNETNLAANPVRRESAPLRVAAKYRHYVFFVKSANRELMKSQLNTFHSAVR